MRENKLAARRKRAFRPRTTLTGKRVASNLIKELEPSALDQVWVSDISYVATLEGWLYLAVILDLFSRKGRGLEAGREPVGRDVNCESVANQSHRTIPAAMARAIRSR
jgi:putative transposase